MKKLLIILLLFSAIESFGQAIPGYTWINSRNRWFVGLFNGLGLPTGDSAHFMAGQAQYSGAMFFDSTDNSTPAGFYIYDRGDWVLQGTPATVDLPNELLAGGTVTPLGGYDFAVQAAIYRIDNVIYASDSGTVTIDSSDATLNRIDRIYLARDELIHVLVGELATNALEPQVEGDQIGLAFITIPAASDPFIVTTKVYDENTESVVTNTGTTTDGNNATNVYVGTKSLNVTNINNNDVFTFTKAPSLSTWDILGFDGLSMFIKLKAVMPSAGNLRVRIQIAGNAVSSEVIIPIDKTNITTYQAITVPASAFGNITNTQVTQVRIRYTRTASTANYTGFYMDNVFFQEGVTQPTGNAVSHTLNITGFNVSPQPTIGNTGTWNASPTIANSGYYYNGSGGWTLFPEFVDTVSGLDGRSRVADGGVVDGRELFLQTVNGSFPGLATSDMFNRVYLQYYISPGATIGDSLIFVVPGNDSVTFVKNIVWGAVWGITDSTILIDTTGGGGSGGRFGVTGEDDIATAARAFDLDGNGFTVRGITSALLFESYDLSDNFSRLSIPDPQNILFEQSILGTTPSYMGLSGNQVKLSSSDAIYFIDNLAADLTATKVVVYNTTSEQIGTVDLSGLGGGGSSLLPVTGTGTATGNVIGDLDGNTLTVGDGDNVLIITPASFASGLTAGDGTASSTLGLHGDLVGTTVGFDLISNNGANTVSISGAAIANTLTYTAAQHTTAGLVRLNTLGGSGTRLVITDNDGDLSGSTLGTGVQTALGVNIGSAGAPVLFNGAGGTPTSLTLTNATGLPHTSITGLGSGVATWWATPSSANLAAALTNETGTGVAVFGTSPTFTTSILLAGATSGNITLASDALSNVAKGTNLSGTGAIPFVQTTRVLADETLANSNADQNLFGAAHDVITVQANTTYQFYITGDFTHSAVAHSIALGFTPTTATVSSIEYNSRAWVTAVGTATASGVHTRVKSTATTIINLSGANATESFEAWGTITIGNTGGTITPQIKFSADPTGTILLKAGARMTIWATGNDTYTVDGTSIN